MKAKNILAVLAIVVLAGYGANSYAEKDAEDFWTADLREMNSVEHNPHLEEWRLSFREIAINLISFEHNPYLEERWGGEFYGKRSRFTGYPSYGDWAGLGWPHEVYGWSKPIIPYDE